MSTDRVCDGFSDLFPTVKELSKKYNHAFQGISKHRKMEAL